MRGPGIYNDVPESEYHSDPCETPSLSSSIAKIICSDSPLHAWVAHPRLNPEFEPDDSKARDFGTIVHSLLLKGEDCSEILDFKDYKTNAAKDARDKARSEGKVPILSADWKRVSPMLQALTMQLQAHHDAKNAFTNGSPEQTIIWQEDNGLMCRSRLDWLHHDLRFFDDYKSRNGSANPEMLEKTMLAEGWDIQEAFYRRGLTRLFGEKLELPPVGRFIAQETVPPFAVGVVTPGADVLMLADKKVLYAIETFGRCLKSGIWAGYSSRTIRTGLPAWAEQQWIEKELKEVGA